MCQVAKEYPVFLHPQPDTHKMLWVMNIPKELYKAGNVGDVKSIFTSVFIGSAVFLMNVKVMCIIIIYSIFYCLLIWTPRCVFTCAAQAKYHDSALDSLNGCMLDTFYSSVRLLNQVRFACQITWPAVKGPGTWASIRASRGLLDLSLSCLMLELLQPTCLKAIYMFLAFRQYF